jgi:hypothetical protein
MNWWGPLAFCARTPDRAHGAGAASPVNVGCVGALVARFYRQRGSATMGQNQPITLGAAAAMAFLAAPVLAQTPSPKSMPVPGTAAAPRQSLSPKGAALVVPIPVPVNTPAKPGAGPIEGLGVEAPPARSRQAGFGPKVLVEPLILWQPEGSTSPSPAAAPQSSSATSAGRPPGGAVRSAARPSRPDGLVDSLAPMGPGAGINPFLPGMAPPGGGGYQVDPRRRAAPGSPGGGLPSAGPQQRLRQGPNGMRLGPGAGSPLGAPPQGPMSERMMPPSGAVPPGMLPPGAVPYGMMAPGAIPPGALRPDAGRPGPGAMPPGALPPGDVSPGGQAPDAPAAGSPAAGAKSAQEWSPWPSLLATLGLGGCGVLLAYLARRRSASGSPTREAIGDKGLKNAPLGHIQTVDKTD